MSAPLDRKCVHCGAAVGAFCLNREGLRADGYHRARFADPIAGGTTTQAHRRARSSAHAAKTRDRRRGTQ
jgi:hypothetical protein